MDIKCHTQIDKNKKSIYSEKSSVKNLKLALFIIDQMNFGNRLEMKVSKLIDTFKSVEILLPNLDQLGISGNTITKIKKLIFVRWLIIHFIDLNSVENMLFIDSNSEQFSVKLSGYDLITIARDSDGIFWIIKHNFAEDSEMIKISDGLLRIINFPYLEYL